MHIAHAVDTSGTMEMTNISYRRQLSLETFDDHDVAMSVNPLPSLAMALDASDMPHFAFMSGGGGGYEVTYAHF